LKEKEWSVFEKPAHAARKKNLRSKKKKKEENNSG